MAGAEQSKLKEYLLDQLTEDEEEQVDERLLSDPDFVEEHDIVVDELIHDYVAGRLPGEDVQRMKDVFFRSAERADKLKFALALKQYKFDLELKRLRRQQLLKLCTTIAASVLLVVGGFYAWRVWYQDAALKQGLAALQSAYRDERPLEARLSDFPYAPLANQRGGPPKTDSLKRDLASSLLLKETNDHPNARSHHALGQYYLAERKFDQAIDQFKVALELNPNNAKIHGDLGAAWLEKGKIDSEGQDPGKGIEQLARAFEHLNKALVLDPNLLESLFNRAICEEKMTLNAQAANDWSEYLKKDPNSAWADEARRRLERLEQQKNKIGATKEKLFQDFLAAYQAKDDETAWRIISQQRDLSGGLVANTLIDAYLELAGKGDREESLKKLDALIYTAKLEKTKAGDLFVSDVARFLQSASPAQLKVLVEARQMLQLGRKSLFESKLDSATEHLNRARSLFENIGERAEATYVEYPIGHAYLLQSKSNLSLTAFERVVRESEARKYRWLTAQALNATANAQIGLTNYSAALEASHRSLALSKEIGDTNGLMKTTNQLAQQYFRLGNYAKSLDLHQQSLALSGVFSTEPIQMWRNYFTIAMPLNALGLHSAAIEYEKEALGRAEALKMPQSVCRSYSILGLMYAGQGNYQEAIRNGELAVTLAEKIPSQASQKESIAYSSLQLGLINRQSGDFASAVTHYDQAIQLYRELENQAFSYVAHKGKLLSCMRQTGCSSVEAEIKICLDLFETYRAKILEESNRAPFFDTEQDIYDVAIDYEFSRQHFETAFDYSEQARARSLLDLTGKEAKLIGGAAAPDLRFNSVTAAKGFAEIKTALPAEAQVLQYAVLGDKLVMWLISKTENIAREKSVSIAYLNEILFRFLKQISSPSGNAEELSADALALYDLLIKPVEGMLRKDQLLCIVPDKTLNYLPFGALISSSSGKYLVSEFRLIQAPSATMFLHSSALASQKDKVRSESLLSVGNPRFSRQQFPELHDLPASAREAQEIKQYYERAQVLLGGEAQKASVEAGMKQSEVVHLALHSIVNEASPLRSSLILAAGSNREGAGEGDVLEAYEIYRANLAVTRLAILSACDTGIGRYYRGEGIMGLSRSFIAAGVPLVVGSLWPVDSDSTADLMIAFHRYRKTQHLSTAAALQKAQQDMATGADPQYRHPYYWAAFTLVGGYARF